MTPNGPPGSAPFGAGTFLGLFIAGGLRYLIALGAPPAPPAAPVPPSHELAEVVARRVVSAFPDCGPPSPPEPAPSCPACAVPTPCPACSLRRLAIEWDLDPAGVDWRLLIALVAGAWLQFVGRRFLGEPVYVGERGGNRVSGPRRPRALAGASELSDGR